MNCPSEEQFYDWLFEGEGQLPPDAQAHIAECAKCANKVEVFGFLHKGLTGLQEKVTAPTIPLPPVSAVASAPDEPKRIGNYLILERLGEGGMGVVYKAFNVSSARMVALKLVKPPYCTDPAYEKRFLAECRVSAQLNHPNIVQLIDQGVGNGHPFCAMEYVKGTSLDRLLARDGLIPAPTAVRIMSQIAAGLGEAHRQRVVHRDIKPSNILLEDNLERVKITDFGVMKDLNRETSVTQPGLLVGTLNFMAPEQVEGKPVTPATDVFAAGAILYQMLTGKLPFNDGTPTGVMRKIVDQPHQSLHEFGDLVPAFLREIVDKCLAKEPAKRFQSGAELAEALNRCDGTGNGNCPGEGHREKRSLRRGGIIAVLIASIVLVVGASWLLWSWSNEDGATAPRSGTTEEIRSSPGMNLVVPAGLKWKPVGGYISECLRLGPFIGKHDGVRTAEILAFVKTHPESEYKGERLVRAVTEAERFDGVPPGCTAYFICYLRCRQNVRMSVRTVDGAGLYISRYLDSVPVEKDSPIPLSAGVHCLVVKVMTNGGGGTRIAVEGEGIEQAMPDSTWDVFHVKTRDPPEIDTRLLPDGMRWAPGRSLLDEGWRLGPFPRDNQDELILSRLRTYPHLSLFDGLQMAPAAHPDAQIVNRAGERVYHVFYLRAKERTSGRLFVTQPAGTYTTLYLNGRLIPYCGPVVLYKGVNVLVFSFYSNGDASVSISFNAPQVEVGLPAKHPEPTLQ